MQKIKKLIGWLLILSIGVAGFFYIQKSLEKSSAPPEPSRTPSLPDAPLRVYGLVEPLNREIFLGPLQTRRVIAVFVKEGDTVRKNQALCMLEQDLEIRSIRIAQSRVEEAKRQLAVIQNDLALKRQLAASQTISEFELTQIELQAKLMEQQIETAQAEERLREAELEKLTLRAPSDGIVYKMDVRVGEQLIPQDYTRIVIGRAEKQVRLFVETFWLHSIRVGQRCRVLEAETLRETGTGSIISVSPYVGARDFRTDDRLERIDTKYAQAIVKLDSLTTTPIGMQVIGQLLPDDNP